MSRVELVSCDHSYGIDGTCARSAPLTLAKRDGWLLGDRDLCPPHAGDGANGGGRPVPLPLRRA